MSEEDKALLAITMGDAAGSGPEIITKALAEPEVRKLCRPVVIGDAGAMKEAFTFTRAPGEVKAIDKLAEARFQDGIVEVIDLHNIELDKLTRGRVDPMAGKAAYEYIKLGTEMSLAGESDAIVTSAINKEAFSSWPIFLSMVKRSLIIEGARPRDGSSSNMSLGRAIQALPITPICCSPPERYPLFWLRNDASLGK